MVGIDSSISLLMTMLLLLMMSPNNLVSSTLFVGNKGR
jgi:hypothetical protein